MSNYPYITTQKGFYSSYWDTGLYGNYFRCAPEHVKDIIQHNAEAYACNSPTTQPTPTKSPMKNCSEPNVESTTKYYTTRPKTI
jgi:hypothetical protein